MNNDILKKIPANKFSSPRLYNERLLSRNKLLEKISKNGRSKQVILVTAKAGQGKTTLARQYLEHRGARFAWYQVGTEDADSILFFTALLACLKYNIRGFKSPDVEKLISSGNLRQNPERGI